MRIARRELLAGAAATATALFAPATVKGEDSKNMYGLIGKIISARNRRDDPIAILQESSAHMPGCFSYVIAKDVADVNTIWVTEVWDSEANHQASLSLPAVNDAIGRAKPIIAGFSKVAVTNPVAGVDPAK
jgi:quinol monooxygenase YgiN